jgi:hypothetical protein
MYSFAAVFKFVKFEASVIEHSYFLSISTIVPIDQDYYHPHSGMRSVTIDASATLTHLCYK